MISGCDRIAEVSEIDDGENVSGGSSIDERIVTGVFLARQAGISIWESEMDEFAANGGVFGSENGGGGSNRAIRAKLVMESQGICYILSYVYRMMFNRRVLIRYSLHDGFYCVDEGEKGVSSEDLVKIEENMRNVLKKPLQYTFKCIETDYLIEYFEKLGYRDKINVIRAFSTDKVKCVKINEFIDIIIGDFPLYIDANKVFQLKKYKNGFILRLPTINSPTVIQEWREPESQHAMFNEYSILANQNGVNTITDLNLIIEKQEYGEIIKNTEEMHQKKLEYIANEVVKLFKEKRIITIAGPSSSNKTTFAKLLALKLNAIGYEAIVCEMDDFSKNRVDIPFGSDGLRDFESVHALDLGLFGDRIHSLLNGETVPRRKFDFKTGIGYDMTSEMLSLPDKTFLIIEGIHGINPELISAIGNDNVIPIYVAPLTPLPIDYDHRFSTTELRLIRRMIRDHKYRGYSARKTILRWTAVRVGEEKNIFPYQNNAMFCFNSSLLYELPIYSLDGISLLSEALNPEPDEDPNSCDSRLITAEARRILALLKLFKPIPKENVPLLSCIREFIGGSALKY